MKNEEELSAVDEKWRKLLKSGKQEFIVGKMEEGDYGHGGSTSSSDDSTSSSDDSKSSSDDSKSSSNDSKSSSDDSKSSSDDSTSSSDDSTSSSDDSTPSHGGGPPGHGGGPLSHGGGPPGHGGGLFSHGGGPPNRGISTFSRGTSTSNHGGSPSGRGGNPSNRGIRTFSRGTSTSNHGGYTFSHEGFTSNYANVMFGHGGNTSRKSADTSSHGSKTCIHVSNIPSDDEDNSPFGKTIHNALEKCNMPDLKLKQTWTCSKSVVPYFKQLIEAYEGRYFAYVYIHLEESRLVVLINKELAIFFNNESQDKKSKSIIRPLRAIHSLILNPLSIPKVITKVLKRTNRNFNENFWSPLFDARCHYNYGSFCFLTKEILTNILSELFRKTDPEVWLLPFLTMLHHLCLECFGEDCRKPATVSFGAIAAYLIIGIEVLPPQFYPSLKYYFSSMFGTVSRNKLSSHCIKKIWYELMLFYDHWVKYALSYPHLQCLDSSHSAIKFENCEEPDLSIFDNTYIRNRMRYEYVHAEDGYLPCEYPSVPSFPKLPKTYPTLEEMQQSRLCGSFLESSEFIAEDIIGPGCCEECKKSNCSCVQDYIKSWNEQQLLSESEMEVDEVVETVSSDEVVENVSSDKQKKPSHISEPQFGFDPSRGADIDRTSEEMSEYYDSFIKHKTCSYSFSDSQIRITGLTSVFSFTSTATLRERKEGLSPHKSDSTKDEVSSEVDMDLDAAETISSDSDDQSLSESPTSDMSPHPSEDDV